MNRPRSRRRSAALLGGGLLALATLAIFLSASPRAHAKGKDGDRLRYAMNYADAVREARARNTFIFATFHKDN